LINDLVDLERDRLHPVKSRRPLAAGLLSPALAGAAALIVVSAAVGGAFALGTYFGLVALVYFGLMTAYSFFLKNVVIIDVLTVAFAFVLRAIAGAVAIEVASSNWLLIVTMLLALFLALSKRRHELTLLAGEAAGHRRILGEYSPYLLDQMIAVVYRLYGGLLRPIHPGAGDGFKVRYREIGVDPSLRTVRNIPLLVPRPPKGCKGAAPRGVLVE